jgi:DNA-binding NarL/FixJ family response regulator
MLTVRGRYVDGTVVLLERVPFKGRQPVLVTFLESQDLVLLPSEVGREAAVAASGLTPREIEVLTLIQRGLTNREVALELKITPGTVRNHTSAIYRKLDVRNRLEAVQHCVELGVLGASAEETDRFTSDGR